MCNHHGQNGSTQSAAHSGLKVTVTYEGHPEDIDDAIHGPSREAQQRTSDLDQAEYTIDVLSGTLSNTIDELHDMTCKAQDLATDLADSRRLHAQLEKGLREALSSARNDAALERDAWWAATSAMNAAQNREMAERLGRAEENARHLATISKLKVAVEALSGAGFSAKDVLADRAAKNALVYDVNQPMINTDFTLRHDAIGNRLYSVTQNESYPWILLRGERSNVKQQVLACYVDDRRRESKIQAIKNLRERSGLGLKEAKDLVDWAIGQAFTDR